MTRDTRAESWNRFTVPQLRLQQPLQHPGTHLIVQSRGNFLANWLTVWLKKNLLWNSILWPNNHHSHQPYINQHMFSTARENDCTPSYLPIITLHNLSYSADFSLVLARSELQRISIEWRELRLAGLWDSPLELVEWGLLFRIGLTAPLTPLEVVHFLPSWFFHQTKAVFILLNFVERHKATCGFALLSHLSTQFWPWIILLWAASKERFPDSKH